MAKSSKSCGYTGHMRIMDRVNNTKTMYQSNQAKSHKQDNNVKQHPKHQVAYPEAAAEARAEQEISKRDQIRGKCNCNKLDKN